MALKSKYPDIPIPDNVSWPQIVYQHFDKYGEQTAIVSIFQFVFNAQTTAYGILTYNVA